MEIIPEYFQADFKEFSKLETEQEKALFWSKREDLIADAEEFSKQLLNGLQLLNHAVIDLQEEVIAAKQT